MTPKTVLIAVAPEVIEELFTRDAVGNRLSVAWGEPDADGFHEPTVTVHFDDNLVAADRAALRLRVEGLPEVLEVALGYSVIARDAVLALLDKP